MDTPQTVTPSHSESLARWQPALTCWYPHSGGRWLNRGLIGRHPLVQSSELFSPLLMATMDDLLGLDKTFQVHKSRTQLARKAEFEAVLQSMSAARHAGIAAYLACIRETIADPARCFYAALPVGSQVAVPNLDIIHSLLPGMTLIHLVRNPVDCFASLKSRGELDGNAAWAAAAWLRLNLALRQYGIQHPRHYRLVRYEDLCQDPRQTALVVLQTMGLDWHDNLLEGIDEYHGRNQGIAVRQIVEAKESTLIADICRLEARNYGYDLD